MDLLKRDENCSFRLKIFL